MMAEGNTTKRGRKAISIFISKGECFKSTGGERFCACKIVRVSL